ncbi:MAG: DUF1801 domain-containing protein, partial [Akkermansiaceae bacterium]
MQRDCKTPADYHAAIEGEQKEMLLAIREVILDVNPDTEEIIEYGMLGYTDVANLAAQKHYIALYVAPKAMATYKEKHPDSNCGKSCLRMRNMKQVNLPGIRQLLET